jgi:hypothetical protein
MDPELTEEERRMLVRIESAGRWDTLISDLSLLTPCFILVGFGIHLDSPAAIITGLLVNAAFALRTSIQQAKAIPVMKSLLKKLTRNADNPRAQREDPKCLGAG